MNTIKAETQNHEVLVRTEHLKKYFKTPAGLLHAVDDVSISIKKGETLGVVGESGCGKSTLGRTIIRLLSATDGIVEFEGENILKYSSRQIRKMSNKMQIIFQDPYSSLDPRMTVSQIIAEPLRLNGLKAGTNEILKLMDIVGLSSRYFYTYPHEMDGGRRQRIGIARALSLNPKFIVCDEPVSALDVSIQAQILNLLMDLQDELGLTYMFITHNLSVVKHISDEIAVMYLGQCVEKAESRELFANPLHPYTKALLSSIPVANLKNRNKKKDIIKGEVFSPINPKPGCRFAPRCNNCTDSCLKGNMELIEYSDNHFVACNLYKTKA